MLERGGARGDPAGPDPHRGAATRRRPDVGIATVTTPDALDFYGYWKLFDGSSDAAFYGRNRGYALGNTRSSAIWASGATGGPVRELVVFGQP